MANDLKVLLRQLKPDELQKLARQYRFNQSEVDKKGKAELVNALAMVAKKQDITELLSKHGRVGLAAAMDGSNFEKKMLNYFSSKDYKCEINNRKIPGMEFDVVGVKKGFWETRWIIAECKNKPKVTMQDFDKFLGKYHHFVKTHKETPEYVDGLLVTTGVFEPLVQKSARAHKEITLKRVKA
jgi:hypothetical protein